MYYINYYSKLRLHDNMTDEELDNERTQNAGRIATKLIENKENIRYNEGVDFVNGMCDRINSFAVHSQLPCTDGVHVYDSLYEKFLIPKRRGGFREINAPNDELKLLQQQILYYITHTLKFLPHNAAHGFTKHRNCKTALEVHAKNRGRWFLKLDIKDFFPNTTTDKILSAMQHVYPFCLLPEQAQITLVAACVMDGCTPQGAPTSPVLSNLVMVENDVNITKYCKEHGLTYTRYADDILISCPAHFEWRTVQEDIQNILTGYTLKTEKTRYGSFNGRNWNLGLMYNNEYKITVGHAKKKWVKNAVHNYVTKPNERTMSYAELQGIISYCAYIEPEYFNKYLQKLQEIFNIENAR